MIRVLVLLLVLFPSFALARDANWARPMTLAGVPNLNQVTPFLYRSAQPDAAGFANMAKTLKVKTVIDLRESQTDEAYLANSKIRPFYVPMNAMHITNEEIIAALTLIRAHQGEGPILVHCQHGADRTGVVIAMYRIIYQGWSKQQAIDEMKNGGYNFHSIFFNIPAFINNADIPALKAAIALD
jgi:protein tyrosine/serine phosphatase